MLQCEKCNTRIQDSQINTRSFSPCGNCGALMRTDIFPASVREAEQHHRQQSVDAEDDAGCFYHPAKKAVVHCSACGRFLCALCDIEMDNTHICFSCMAAGKEKKSLTALETDRFLYDGLALRLSIIPLITLFFSWATCITAPAAAYISIRYWNAESGITPRKTKWRFGLALAFSLLQIAGWIALVIMLILG